jgi:hypothetical protein
VNAKERHFEVVVVHRCSPEGGDSILSVLFLEPLRALYNIRYFHIWKFFTGIGN